MSIQRPPKRDDAIDKVRTIYWFQYLGMRIGSFRPRAVQRAVAPIPATDALGGVIKNNKFLGYSRGDHVPNTSLVQRVATIYPDSAYILNHVIWEVLRGNDSIEKHVRRWIGQLDPDIQKAVIKSGNQLAENSHTLEMLERRFSLDSLAALTILFRLNREDERSNNDARTPHAIRAWGYACGIFRVLMMMEPQFLTEDLKNGIFKLFVQRVFSLTTSFWGVRMNLEEYDYPKAALLLRDHVTKLRIYIRSPMNREVRSRVNELIMIPFVPVNSS